MKRGKERFILYVFLAGSLLLSACASLLETVEEAVQTDYGPAYTVEEHQLRTFDAAWEYLAENYIHFDSAEVDWDAVRATYADRILAGLTNEEFNELMRELSKELPSGALTFQSRAERIEADTADFSTFEGIGAVLGFQEQDVPHVVILDVMAGSPAEKAGLKPHDSIYRIDGNPILLEEGLTVVDRIRGPAGSTVTLHVRTPGEAERTIEVTRGKLSSTGQLKAEKISGTQYGYLLFPPISYTAMSDEVLDGLQTFATNQELKGVILDLRVAGSSRGWPLEDLLTLFHTGEMGEFYNASDQVQPLNLSGKDSVGSQDVPLVVLIGRNTSGFPEILAAILQEADRAIVVGEASLGGIETTTAFHLPDGSRIFIETASYRLADGTEIGETGIIPDVVVEAGWGDIQPGADPVLKAALEILDGQP